MTATADRKIAIFDNHEPAVIPPPSLAHRQDLEGERRVRQSIQNAAQRNTSLLSQIAATEDAAHELPNIEHNLDRASKELAEQESEVTRTALHSGVYRLRYDQRRGKVVAKWFYVLSRRREQYDQKVADARLAFETTVQERSRAEMRQKALQQDVERIEREHAAVIEQAELHGKAHAELDELYKSIFDGPTPGFPDEDDVEGRYHDKRSRHRAATKRLKGIRKAVREATLIEQDLKKATYELTSVLEESEAFFFLHQYCILFFNRANHIMEHSLHLAREMANDQADLEDRTLSSDNETLLEALKAIYRICKDIVDRGSEVERENLQHAAESAMVQLRQAEDADGRLLKTLKKYDDRDTRSIGASSRQYEDARQTLHGIRQNAFEVTAGIGASAPAYHECCDRSEGFTNDSLAECDIIEVAPLDEAGMPPPPSYDRATRQQQQAAAS